MSEGISGSPNSATLPTANNTTSIYCAELDIELLQAKLEITSLEKIIKILQEELNMKRTLSNEESEVMFNNDVFLTQQTEADNNNWKEVKPKQLKRRPKDKLELMNPKEQTVTQLMSTENRYHPLTNLQEDVSVDAMDTSRAAVNKNPVKEFSIPLLETPTSVFSKRLRDKSHIDEAQKVLSNNLQMSQSNQQQEGSQQVKSNFNDQKVV
jgi:hypothetical protein